MDNPVETIGTASARIARLAAIRMMLCAVAPALTAIALGLLLEPIGDVTWARYGYALAPDRANVLSLALIGAGIAVLVAGSVMAFRAYRRANDFVAAAAELDDRLECDQEIVTFATLADPSAPESSRARRTPLFPVLWRRAIAMFVGLDVRREFRLEVGEPLKRSSIFAGVVALAMVLATLGLVRAPTPENTEAAKLRSIAEEIAKTATSSDDTVLADKIRQAADALENSKLPPEEKKKRIEDAMREADKAAQKRNNSQSGKNQGTGKSTAQSGKGNGKGQGNSSGSGSGEGKSGTGVGQNAGGNNPGAGKGGTGKNSGKNDGGKGSAKNDQNKGDQSNIELQNELAKAEAQVETANAKNPGPESKPGNDKNQGGANKPGEKVDQKSGSQPNPNRPGEIPKPGASGDRNIPSAGGNPKNNKDLGSNMGDTHLGEMPTSTNAQRFLKPGEKGSTVDIKDARYVMFRLPGAPTSGNGGKTVLDTDRPTATTAYVNAPLAPTSDNAPPDERQLVPPRYRDMIH
ncbi:MAG TPA: hypothetical protein VJX68_03370 [Candidatus Binatus sp.]|uniref:hypothetical protein n=1 Tax=Candidatus Binatus sp. TaxID=2811406 RepID=UPI002B469A4B|nr:hypothetical protein [Candidatus Binatus sp.]HKN12213.1 hypothetical protein [Candidatus Binatus sp.]